MFATRPESALLVGVFALYVLFTKDRRILALGSPWLGIIAVVTLWRLYYYGALIPNSITAKSPPGYSPETLQTNALKGLDYLGGFAWAAAPLVLGALFALVVARRNPVVWLCFGAFAAEV